jgi:hypothetical protein
MANRAESAPLAAKSNTAQRSYVARPKAEQAAAAKAKQRQPDSLKA